MTSPKPDQGSLSKLRGVGPAIREKLAKLGLTSFQDLLFHLPLRYEDRTRITPIGELRVGDRALIEGELTAVSYPTGGKTRMLCAIRDSSRRIHLRFFQVYPQHKNMMKLGNKFRLFGEVGVGPTGLEMVHPELVALGSDKLPLESSYSPVYPTTEGLSQNMWRKIMQQVLALLHADDFLQEFLPQTLLDQNNFPSLKQALAFVHRPPQDAELKMLEERRHPMLKRLVFEELLAHRLGLLKFKDTLKGFHAEALEGEGAHSLAFVKTLPYTLTGAQQRVGTEIAADLERPHPMLRLVQGDVGSGKTVVAARAALRAIEKGFQAAVMAPTELLAEQHYRVFQSWFAPLNIKTVFLSGQVKAKERRETVAAITDGSAQFIVGTHALFQKEVTFANLALIIVDEQHRFGVHQRALFREKGVVERKVPHQLIMTATPIPRTLAMSMYADIDCSVIDELPPGRLPIQTSVISSTRREEVIDHVKNACHTGRQAYWVCSLIEESDALQCEAAEKTAELFKTILPGLKIGLIHGRMKSAEKDAVMQAFKANQVDVLVATTVIEVGVDVPNASLMIIENAERLGLSQLHQLRGRVGRGKVESHCLLIYQGPLSEYSSKRLTAIRSTQDGFKIAEHDLELRGPGDVLGTRQTGEMNFKVADLLRDSDLLTIITNTANTLMQAHQDLAEKIISRWLHNTQQYQHV